MSKTKFIRLSKSCIGKEEKKAVLEVLDREFLGMGEEVKKFEEELSNTKLILEGGEKNNWDLPLESKLPIIYNYVGDNFSYEARSVHYNDKKRSKGIYGKASVNEIKELSEEGIETETIPWINDSEN